MAAGEGLTARLPVARGNGHFFFDDDEGMDGWMNFGARRAILPRVFGLGVKHDRLVAGLDER